MPELDILRKALCAVDDKDVLERLRAQAPQIRAALEEEDVLLDDASIAVLAQHPEWLASVYAALADAEALDIEPSEEQRDAAAMLAQEEEAIADAWAALLDKLDEMRAPAGPGRWELELIKAGKPDPELVEHLRRHHPSCRDGDPAAQRLLQYGLTPGMIFEALQSIELLFDRTLRRSGSAAVPRKITAGDTVVKDGSNSVVISQKLLNGNLAGTLDLDLGLVPALARSLRCMLQASPLLVDGYLCAGENAFFKLPDAVREDGFLRKESLVQRWCASEFDFVHRSGLLQRKLERGLRGIEAPC